MEAPTPKIFNNQKIYEFSSITDKQNKLELKIILLNSQLEILAKVVEKNPIKIFQTKETENNLLKNPYLLTGGNILGIFQILEYYIKKNSFKIYEENDLIKLEIIFEHPIIKNIIFNLSEEKKDIKYQVNELSYFVYETLVNKIKILEEKNKEYESKFKDIFEINKKYENRIKDLENIIRSFNDSSKKEYVNKIFNSNIKIDESLIKLWLNNRRFKATLLFRMSRDGYNFADFHKKCDKKGITIIFIETKDDFRFGGYTELEWDSYSFEKKDNSTFLFSFNNKEKYSKRNNNYSICCSKDQGPKFGWGPQIYFYENLINGRSIKSDNNSFVLDNIFVDGKEEWETKEIEVFQIIYF